MSFPQQLSDYELLREKYIRERKKMFDEVLKAKAEFDLDFKVPSAKKRSKKLPKSILLGEPRRSLRLQGNSCHVF